MGVKCGTGLVKNGLVFAYDHDDPKSFKGRPLTNYAYIQHARIDDSYATYEATATAPWPANHADALTVYNNSGTNITGYVNTGVTSYESTSHAIWSYDSELRRPVVVMRDWDSQWKAKNWAVGYSMTGMGLASTDNYTISWLQWTTNTAKSVNAGLYGLNNVASNGFHDGLAHSVDETSTKNSKSHTWERVHCTFTVASNWDFTDPLNCYMYGYYNVDGTLKIADVQIEADSTIYSGFHGDSLTRSSTEAIIDRAGGNTVTVQSLTYGDNSFSFNGTSDYLTVGALGLLTNFTVIAWVKPSSHPATYASFVAETYSGSAVNFKLGYNGVAGQVTGGFYNGTWRLSPTTTTTIGTWQCIATTYDGANIAIYKNGAYVGQTAETSATTAQGGGFRIGRRWDSAEYFPGEMDVVQIYNRALSASEIKQNFDALKGRFGL